MSKTPIRILLADDHDLYLDGLKGLFQTQHTYEVVAEAHNGMELVMLAELYQPQIVLTDLRMPLLSGAHAINKITQASPTCKCLVLTNYENDLSVIEALEAGARGYITKNMPKQELFTALDQICRGYPYFCQATTAKMVRLISRSSYNPFSRKRISKFSQHERTLIYLICLEKSNQEIAHILSLSPRTIENNRARIYKKMCVKTSAGVAIYAIKNNIVSMNDLEEEGGGELMIE